MTIKRPSVAGTLESSDAFVSVEPCLEGVCVELESPVMAQFGESIRASVMALLAERSVERARVSIQDRGALDCTIRARVEVALMRACAEA